MVLNNKFYGQWRKTIFYIKYEHRDGNLDLGHDLPVGGMGLVCERKKPILAP